MSYICLILLFFDCVSRFVSKSFFMEILKNPDTFLNERDKNMVLSLISESFKSPYVRKGRG